MAKVRERFWIPKLLQPTKRVIHKCHGRKRFRAVACPTSAVGDLLLERTSDSRQFQVISINFVGPIITIKEKKQEGKTYIFMYSSSLIRAVYMDLMRDQVLEEFLTSLQRFIVRRGTSEKVNSDKFSVFVAASKWLKGILREEKIRNFLGKHRIKWRFNLNQAPW